MSIHRRVAALSGLLAGTLLLAFAGPPGTAQAATGTTLYASPTGSGSACTVSAPCSLTGAQRTVRAVDGSMSSDITVYLRGGTYTETTPLSFGPQDSGTGGHTVNWDAYPGEVPVISGGKKVTGFSLYDSSKNIYRAAVPAGTQSRQLFVNGVRAQRARGALNPSGFTLSGSSFTTSDASYTSFTNPSQTEIVDDNDWKQMRCPLQSITATSSGGSSLNVDPTCFANNNTDVQNPGYPFNGAGVLKLTGISWIENAYQLLTQPGQFYLDSNAGYLYYIPRTGENLATADVELPTAQELLDLSGTPGHLAPVNDTDPNAAYSGSWSTSTGRAYGDLGGDVHYTTTNGDSVSYTFTGTGLQVLSEVAPDEGGIDVYVDGVKTQSVNAEAATRLAQQAIVSVTGLAKGSHTVKLVKTSGTYMLIDGFTVIPDTVTPVQHIGFQGVTFAYDTWNQPTTSGYVDNQAGVLWDPVTHAPTRIPAAVQVHRGNDISFTRDTFTHLGGTGLDLADGTQNSNVTGSIITDTSGGGVSLGEVDDYYQTQTDLMTTGDTVADNTISYVGQDYHDAVGVWAGYTRNASIANNDIGYTPYSGISLGWGWGWASCTLKYTTCHHGTIYAGGNRITGNSVHNVMRTLHDGGPIYTNGGQGGGDGSMTSVLSGNVVAEGNDTNNMLYQDEGSSYWDTYDNVTRFGGSNWIGMWISTIHDIDIHDNYSDNASYNNAGTNITFNQATIVSSGAWPAAAQGIIAAARPSGQYRPLTGRIDDDEPTIAYTGSWSASANRGYGDFDDGVHYTTTNGDSASYTFAGTGVQILGEKSPDQGNVEVYLDGVSQGQVDTSATAKQAQQVVYSVQGLTPGSHTVQLVKRSGTYTTLDGFEITRTVDDTDAALQYTGSWTASTNRGDGDYGDDVHYAETDGDSVTVSFYGTGISYVTETNTDEGTVDVSLDGASQGSVSANASSRHAQQTLYTASGLGLGYHTLTLTKAGGTYLVVDRFDIS
ncbi:hypothetical protein ABH940_001204 [Streptacidiphilus sp. BW17]|uniref:hypothetical protein n=1 Tax=Streptacidiphilus sp. BW17 TaxID=3156274 RepID=UPI0035145A03